MSQGKTPDEIYYIKKVGDKNDGLLQYFRQDLIPTKLMYKYGIFKEFESQLKVHAIKKIQPVPQTTRPIYILKWRRFKEGMMFKLNRNVHQMKFKDKSQMFVNSHGKPRPEHNIITVIDKDNMRTTFFQKSIS